MLYIKKGVTVKYLIILSFHLKIKQQRIKMISIFSKNKYIPRRYIQFLAKKCSFMYGEIYQIYITIVRKNDILFHSQELNE